MRLLLCWCVALTALTRSAFGFECEIMPPPQGGVVTRLSGNPTMLMCQATEDDDRLPAATVTWYSRQGDAFQRVADSVSSSIRSITGGRLMFVDTKMSDANTYKCEVNVDGATKSCQVEIIVNEKIEFVDAPTEQNPRVGGDAEIVCRITGSPPPLITWTYGAHRTLTNDDRRGYEFRENGQVLVIPSYQSSDDGVYNCMATQTDTGNFDQKKIEVKGFVAPVITNHPELNETHLQGRPVTFNCTGTGTPLPTFHWYKGESEDELESTDHYRVTDIEDEATLTVVGRRLHIVDLMAADIDRYTCRAVNQLDTAEYSTFLKVFLKPSIEPMDAVVVSGKEHVKVPCRFSGDGDLRATWTIPTGKQLITPTKDAPVQQPNDNMYVTVEPNTVTLHIISASTNNAGKYTCQVRNEAGSVVEYVQLRVKHAPLHIAHSDTPVRAVMGQKTEVFCEAEAVPLPDWVWTGPGGHITSGNGINIRSEPQSATVDKSTLILNPKSPADFGEYHCRASNVNGNESWTTLIVEVEQPLMAMGISVNGSHPTYAQLHIDNYMNSDDKQRPTEVEFRYVTADAKAALDEDFDWDEQEIIALKWVSSSSYVLHGLLPDTEYEVQVRGRNEAGPAPWSVEVPYKTSPPRVPHAPVFVLPAGDYQACNELCRVEWRRPISDGGLQITGYRVEYAPMADMHTLDGSFVAYGDPLPAHQQSLSMQQLRPSAYYTLKLYALNSLGQGQPAEMVIITPSNLQQMAGVSPGLVVLLVVLVLFIICAIIDVACYFLNQCGFIMFVCINCCGRQPPEHSLKQRDLHQLEEANGAMTADDKAPLNRHVPHNAVGTAEEKEPLETTPLNGSAADNGALGKATTV